MAASVAELAQKHGVSEDAVRVFGRPGGGYQYSASEARDKAYQDYDRETSDAWRGKQST